MEETVKFCPFCGTDKPRCGGSDDEWRCIPRSNRLMEDEITVYEYQCRNEDCGCSWWA